MTIHLPQKYHLVSQLVLVISLLCFLQSCTSGQGNAGSNGTDGGNSTSNRSAAPTANKGTDRPITPPSDNTPPSPRTEEFPSRKVYLEFALRNDPAKQVTLYLPKDHDGEAPIPLLLGFDSHARGEMVVEKYKDLAEEEGFALAVSNDSKNGLQPQQSLSIANTTLDDLKTRLNVDPNRVYLAGFSGGARVACLTAQNRSDIAGVIGCAAGYQPDMQGQNFSYFGIVGIEDFNYIELMSLDRVLESLAPPFRIQTWGGGHAWPENKIMEEAWDWMEFRAMAYGSAPRDSSRIEELRSEIQKEIDRCKGADCYELNKLMHSYLRELEDVEGLKAEIRRLAGEKPYKDQRARKMEMEAKEIELREKCQHDIAMMDLGYWQKEISRMTKAGVPETDEGWMNRRILAFMSLVAYSYSNQSLGTNDLTGAEKYIGIYELVDPPNSEHAYFKAKLRIRQGQRNEAIFALQNAVALGFNDPGRLGGDPDFVALKDDPALQGLIGNMRDE